MSTSPEGIDGAEDSALHRSTFTALDIVKDIWTHLGLPPDALESLSVPGSDEPSVPSSFKIGHLAQSSVALSALTAALFRSVRNASVVPRVTAPLRAAVAAFHSERLYSLDGKPAPSAWGPIGGLHKTADGYVRIHDGFPNHKNGALRLLGLPLDATRAAVSEKTQHWLSVDLETMGLQRGLAIYALRSYKQWDLLPQSRAVSDFPITIRKLESHQAPATLAAAAPPPLRWISPGNDRCLRGVRVLDLSRVIAAPVAGRTLAAHGADVLWVTSPGLPDLPTIDRDFARGKRTVQLDLRDAGDKAKLLELARACDVFLQGYRPGSLAAREGLAPEELAAANPGIIVANLSAFGPDGPWADRRGFDSLVQTCSGMNVSEAEHFGAGVVGERSQPLPARPMPCQALDHGAGYLLAAGVAAALYKRGLGGGGSFVIDVSLAAVMKYLRSLGQYEGASGFACPAIESMDDVDDDLFETRGSGFGELRALRYPAQVDGCEPGWDSMPKPLGSDEAEWIQ